MAHTFLLCTVPRYLTLNHADAKALVGCRNVWHWYGF